MCYRIPYHRDFLEQCHLSNLAIQASERGDLKKTLTEAGNLRIVREPVDILASRQQHRFGLLATPKDNRPRHPWHLTVP